MSGIPGYGTAKNVTNKVLANPYAGGLFPGAGLASVGVNAPGSLFNEVSSGQGLNLGDSAASVAPGTSFAALNSDYRENAINTAQNWLNTNIPIAGKVFQTARDLINNVAGDSTSSDYGDSNVLYSPGSAGKSSAGTVLLIGGGLIAAYLLLRK